MRPSGLVSWQCSGTGSQWQQEQELLELEGLATFYDNASAQAEGRVSASRTYRVLVGFALLFWLHECEVALLVSHLGCLHAAHYVRRPVVRFRNLPVGSCVLVVVERLAYGAGRLADYSILSRWA